MSNDLDVPFNAIIPYHVQVDENLSESAKLYFGQITGLAVRCGYIWATDEQLAQMKNTSIRNIQRWNKELEENGFIIRETKNYPVKQNNGSFLWQKKRKIFVNGSFSRERPEIPKKDPEIPKKKEENENSKNVCGTAIFGETIEPAIFGETIEPAKNGDIINKSISNESIKLQPSSVVVFSSLSKLDIDDKLRIKISNEHSQQEIDLAVERCIRWKSRPSDEVGIMTALLKADSWIDNPTPEELVEKHKQDLKNFSKYDGKTIANTKITVGNNYVEFVAGMKTMYFSSTDKEFKKSVIEYIEYLNQLENSKINNFKAPKIDQMDSYDKNDM